MFLKCAKKQFTKRKFKYYFAAVYLNLSIEVLHLFNRTKLKHHLQIMPDCMHVDCFIFYMFELLLILFSLNKKDKAYISDTICFSHWYHFYFLCLPWKHLYLKHCIHMGVTPEAPLWYNSVSYVWKCKWLSFLSYLRLWFLAFSSILILL